MKPTRFPRVAPSGATRGGPLSGLLTGVALVGMLAGGCSTAKSDGAVPTTVVVEAAGDTVPLVAGAGGADATATDANAVERIDHEPGVIPTDLVVEDVAVGTGRAAGVGDALTVEFVTRSWESGKVVSAPSGAAEPVVFRLGNAEVMEGWDQGLIGMRESGRRRLVVPPALASGLPITGAGPGEALVFDVTLLKVTPASTERPPLEVAPGTQVVGFATTDEVLGDGAEAADGALVGINYTAVSATTGRQVWSTWDVGRPSTFRIGAHDVVAGLEQGVVGMKAGGRRRLEVPAELAYGVQGTPGGEVQPGESLVYVVELVTVVP